VDVLVLTTSREVRTVLPSLDLLPHAASTCRPSVQEFLAAGPCDAVLVDGRTHPYAACELSRLVVATERGIPVIGVIEEMVAPEVPDDCAVVQLVLSRAGPAEIDARLRLAQHRRGRTTAGPAGTSLLAVGPFEVDAGAYTVALGGSHLSLTHHEFEVLRTLLVHAGRPLTRAQILADCVGWSSDTSLRAVDCHIRAIRAKLGSQRNAIRTVRGMGYLIPWSPPHR
jgi:hypothetical protein